MGGPAAPGAQPPPGVRGGPWSYLRGPENTRPVRPAPMDHLRNFCIIAHIDHGKSTLADRLLQMTGTIADRDMQAQNLDDMDLERERGITIKSKAIQMNYELNGEKYLLNLIDTPGHVDFSYEVSREHRGLRRRLAHRGRHAGHPGADHQQPVPGPGARSRDHPHHEQDGPAQRQPRGGEGPDRGPAGCKREEILAASGKTGQGVDRVLQEVVHRIPAPKGDPKAPLQALIFDSVFNSFRGIIAYFRVMNGTIRKGEKVKFFNTGVVYDADEIGVLKMDLLPKPQLAAGDVGYIISGIKTASEVKVGDTITHLERPCSEAIKGFEDVKPMVWAGIFPVDTEEYEELRDAMEKLKLNDASLTWTPESSAALGFGFRCGFLGLLHMEIIQERLEREFNMTVITTVPNVSYTVATTKGEIIEVHNPSELPDVMRIEAIEEPYIKAQVITKSEYTGAIMTLCIEKRGMLTNQTYLTTDRVELTFEMPLGEVVFDFYDKLKSISRGYASFDYHPIGKKESDLIKLDILLNSEKVDALSTLIHRDHAVELGRKMCAKLKELLPRQQFEIPVQAAIGAKIIARETVKALRKDVTAKCYGGDISRKRKLLEKQKEGKKRMRQVGSVEIPQQAFLAVLKLD
jgi:GTP-binding protein LepA